MATLKELETEIINIKKRNEKVELDKSWETSLFRKIVIAFLTYCVIVIFMFTAKLSNPFINSIVPSIGFVLSTLSVPFFKKMWIKFCK